MKGMRLVLQMSLDLWVFSYLLLSGIQKEGGLTFSMEVQSDRFQFCIFFPPPLKGWYFPSLRIPVYSGSLWRPLGMDPLQSDNALQSDNPLHSEPL